MKDWGQLQNSANQRVNINIFITGLEIAVNDLPPPKERELLAYFVHALYYFSHAIPWYKSKRSCCFSVSAALINEILHPFLSHSHSWCVALAKPDIFLTHPAHPSWRIPHMPGAHLRAHNCRVEKGHRVEVQQCKLTGCYICLLKFLPRTRGGKEGLQLAACDWESVKPTLTEDGKHLSLSFLLRGSPGTWQSASLSRVIPQTMLTLLKMHFQKYKELVALSPESKIKGRISSM